MARSRSASVGELVAELGAFATSEGANGLPWAAMAAHRFTQPATWIAGRLRAMSLVVVAQGRHAVTVDGDTHVCGPSQGLVLGSRSRVDAVILEASTGRPFLALTLELDPNLVRKVSQDMWASPVPAPRRGEEAALSQAHGVHSVSLDEPLLSLLLLALHGVRTDMDRRVLAPLYVQELSYRLLQPDNRVSLLSLADAELRSRRVSQTIEYLQGHLSEPMTVADLAAHANLSPSAFAHIFREVTGRPPYQFLKEARLDHARTLLDGRATVTHVSNEVGYASVSHFIKEFRQRFGVTPRVYGDLGALSRQHQPQFAHNDADRRRHDPHTRRA